MNTTNKPLVTLALLLVGFMALFLGFNRRLFLRSRASSSAVDFVFDPSSKTVNVGDTFEVKIALGTSMSPFPAYAAANFTLQFDPTFLHVVEIRRAEANVPKFSSLEVIGAANLANRTGLLPLLALETKQAASGASVLVGHISFKAMGGGTSKLSFKPVGPPLEQPMIIRNAMTGAKLPVTNPLPTMQITINGPAAPTPTPTAAPPTATPTPIPMPAPPLGASGGPTYQSESRTDCCNTSLAFDGNPNTFWAGAPEANVPGGEWNLYYGYTTTKPTSSPITITYYHPYYPGSGKLYIGRRAGSTVTWTFVADIPSQENIPPFTAPHEFEFIRLQFKPGRDTPPYVREITPVGDFITLSPTANPSPTLLPSQPPSLTPSPTLPPSPSPTITIIPRPTLTSDQNYTCTFCSRQYPNGGFCVDLNYQNSYYCTQTPVTSPAPNIYCYSSCLAITPTP